MNYLIRDLLKNPTLHRYILSGLAVNVVEFSLLALMIYVWDWWYLWSSGLVFFIALILSFLARKHWVFACAHIHNDLKQLYLYSSFFIISTIVNMIIMYFLVERMLVMLLLAQFISNIIVGFFNYLFNKSVTFKPLAPKQLTIGNYLAECKQNDL